MPICVRKMAQILTNTTGRQLTRSRSRIKPFLRHRRDQGAVAGEDQPAREAAARRRRSGCPGRRGASRRPGTAGGTRAHGRGSRAWIERSNTRPAMRDQGRIEQRHVGGVGEHALVDGRVVRQAAGGADPDVERRLHAARASGSARTPPASARSAARARNRRAPDPASGAARSTLISRLARQVLRPRHVRHRDLVVEARLLGPWKETDMAKIARPCWIALTRRVVKVPPSRRRSTS